MKQTHRPSFGAGASVQPRLQSDGLQLSLRAQSSPDNIERHPLLMDWKAIEDIREGRSLGHVAFQQLG